jgi:hypothetical protein
MKHKKTTPPTKKELGTVSNLSAAEARTRLTRSTIVRCRDAGCEAFKPNGRIDCDALLKFAETLPDLADDDAVDYGLERAKKMRAERNLKEVQVAKLRGTLIDREKYVRFFTASILSCKFKLTDARFAIGSEMKMRLALTDEHTIELQECVRRHHDRVLRELKDSDLTKFNCPNCKHEIKGGIE